MEKNIVGPNIRGTIFLENQGYHGIPRKTYLTGYGTSVISRVGLYPSNEFNCLTVSGSKIFI